MAEDGRNAEFCEKHNMKIAYRCSECQNSDAYCIYCYNEHLHTKHGRPLPVNISDEVEKRISHIEKHYNEGKTIIREFNKLEGDVRQELDGQLEESQAPIEEMKMELKRMMWEVEMRGTEAKKYVDKLDRKIKATELSYNNENERLKNKLQGIRNMKVCDKADKASIQVENEIKEMRWLNRDAIQEAIKECKEATKKLKDTYIELKRRVITREEDTSTRAKMKQLVSKSFDKQLEERKNKIERHLRESETVKGFDKVKKRCREERSKFACERKKRNAIIRQLNISAARAEDLESQLVKEKNELEREKQKGENERAMRLDTEKKLESEMENLKSLGQENTLLKEKERVLINDLLKLQDMLKEKNLEDEKHAGAPKMASSIYTYCFPYTGGNVMYLYNTITGKTSRLTFDNAHPEEYSSTIMAGNNLYIIGGIGPSSAVRSLAIADGVSECKAVKKKELITARAGSGLAQYDCKYIYAIGGFVKGAMKCCEKYNIEQDSWSALKDLNEGRCDLSACVMNEFLYIIAGGPLGAEKKSVERMSIFKEDDGWEMLAIDNADKGWAARIGCGVCKIYEDTIIVFGGYYDKKYMNECYLMKSVKNAAVISKLPNGLAEANSFYRLANCVIRKGELYSLSDDKLLHVYDLKSKMWKIEKGLFP